MTNKFSAALFLLFCGALPFLNIGCTQKKELDWKQQEIMTYIRLQQVEGAPFAQVLVVSSHVDFNAEKLNARLPFSGISGFSFKDPSINRPFDFCPFVLVKTGDSKPSLTSASFDMAWDTVHNPPAWFLDSYKQVERWTLPDGTEALLWQAAPKPMTAASIGILNMSLTEMVLPDIRFKNLRLKVVPLSDADSSVGRLKELSLDSDEIIYSDITGKDVHLRLTRPQINLPRFFQTQDIQLLALDKLELEGEIPATVVEPLITREWPLFKNPKISFNNDKILWSASVYKIRISGTAQLLIRNRVMEINFLSAKVGNLTIPVPLLTAVASSRTSLRANKNMPFELEVGKIKGQGDSIEIFKE